MKKIMALFLCVVLIISFAGCCAKDSKNSSATAEDANKFLTDFFASYTKMNEYLKDPKIAISAFALDGQGLSSILKAVYQAQSVTFAFSEPTEASENVFLAEINVVAPNIEPLYEMYAIDVLLAEEVPNDFVAQSFYDNIRAGTTTSITTKVTVTVRYDETTKGWSVDPSNDLAFAIFPNIDKAG